jgi:hypothetical protein
MLEEREIERARDAADAFAAEVEEHCPRGGFLCGDAFDENDAQTNATAEREEIDASDVKPRPASNTAQQTASRARPANVATDDERATIVRSLRSLADDFERDAAAPTDFYASINLVDTTPAGDDARTVEIDPNSYLLLVRFTRAAR